MGGAPSEREAAADAFGRVYGPVFDLAGGPAPVEVEAALPGAWVVRVERTHRDGDGSDWVDLPGRHTLRGAAEQVMHLPVEGYVHEVRIVRA